MNDKKIFLKTNKISNDLKALDKQVMRSDDPLPKADIVYILNGPKGSGKSSLALNILKSKNGYKKFFDNILLVSPTANRDNKFDKLIKELKEDNKFYDECNENTIEEIVSRLDSMNDEFDEKEEGRKIHNLVIFDDCISALPKSTERSKFNELITTSRHRHTSIWIMSQKYNKINTLIRANTDLISMFKSNNRKEVQTLEDDINVDKQLFEKLYTIATDEPNSFLHVSFFGGGKPKIFKKFNEFIIE